MIKKILNFILYPWHKYQERKAWKKRLADLRKRDPFIYK
jgi:hypothetical protein